MNTLIIFGAKYLFILSFLILVFLLYRATIEKRREVGLFALHLLPLAYIFGVLARALYYNPRPFVVKGFKPLIAHAADNGFPSDHTLLLAALAVVAGTMDRRMAALMWLIAILGGVARVLAGVHHPWDIVGSIIIALIAKWVVYFVLKLRKRL